jgi:hypothetical protein
VTGLDNLAVRAPLPVAETGMLGYLDRVGIDQRAHRG